MTGRSRIVFLAGFFDEVLPMNTPSIALVQGDAAGIGPELMAKLLHIEDVVRAAKIVVFGDIRLYESGCSIAGVHPPVCVVPDLDNLDFSAGLPNLIDTQCIDPATIKLAEVSSTCGAAVLQSFAKGLDACKAGRLDGLCFMPFNKASLHAAGLGVEDESRWARKHIGHPLRVSEFNVIDGMWNARVTSHIPLREVADHLNMAEIVASIELTDSTLRQAGFSNPRIAVAALNPHAGDNGSIGMEEIEVIAPSVNEARKKGIDCAGPFPSDTLYIKVRDGEYDCAVSMYHDQGQIAIKLLGFHMGVSVHGGFPFPMTTPAHGTAFDIAGKNKANVEPSRRAFMMAARMARSKLADKGAG
jgi:4-hydroxythreonine-4-phosphate dehydrogenase